jgi:hypothetical protein
MSDHVPTPTDLAHDLNRAKVELRDELVESKAELRDEFAAGIESAFELADAKSMARHDVIVTRIDGMALTRDTNISALREVITVYREDVDRRFNEADLRYQQRFDAQQRAVQDALGAAEKAVSAALTSADRAVMKAEVAAEKRFESVNEFRNTLADQAATLLPRSEAEARFNAVAEKVGTLQAQMATFVGSTMGNREANDDRRAGSTLTAGQMAAIAAFLVVALMIVALFVEQRQPAAPQGFVPGPVGTQTTPIPGR